MNEYDREYYWNRDPAAALGQESSPVSTRFVNGRFDRV